MSDVWGVDVNGWWVESDEEYPAILQSIREFILYRARDPEDAVSADLRDMRGVFNALSLENSDKDSKSTPNSASDPTDQASEHASESLIDPDLDLQIGELQDMQDSSPDMNWG